MELKVIEESDNLTHIKLIGKMNGEGVQDVETPFTRLVAERLKPTIVDMSEVTFVASLGVRTFMFNVKALHRVQAKMAMVGLQPAVEMVLQVAGLGLTIFFAKTLEEARSQLKLGGSI